MSVSTPWVVQRFEQPPYQDYGARRMGMTPVGEPQTLYQWRDVCEAVTLAIGANSLDENDSPTTDLRVFERDGVVIVVYMKLEI